MAAMQIKGWFRNSKHGRVFQVDGYQKKYLKAGSVVQPLDSETGDKCGEEFTVAAVGSEFKVEKEKYIYLYLSEIVKPAPVAKPAWQYQDEDVAQFEAEERREMSRTGELPGA